MRVSKKNAGIIDYNKYTIMDKEGKTKSDLHDHNNHLPKDVLNAAQDPDSFKDPLEQQLEKSKSMNTPEQNQKLEDIKNRNKDPH